MKCFQDGLAIPCQQNFCFETAGQKSHKKISPAIIQKGEKDREKKKICFRRYLEKRNQNIKEDNRSRGADDDGRKKILPKEPFVF